MLQEGRALPCRTRKLNPNRRQCPSVPFPATFENIKTTTTQQQKSGDLLETFFVVLNVERCFMFLSFKIIFKKSLVMGNWDTPVPVWIQLENLRPSPPPPHPHPVPPLLSLLIPTGTCIYDTTIEARANPAGGSTSAGSTGVIPRWASR
jgi:hypothetical protein